MCKHVIFMFYALYLAFLAFINVLLYSFFVQLIIRQKKNRFPGEILK